LVQGTVSVLVRKDQNSYVNPTKPGTKEKKRKEKKKREKGKKRTTTKKADRHIRALRVELGRYSLWILRRLFSSQF
jgi:hypothetical protein